MHFREFKVNRPDSIYHNEVFRLKRDSGPEFPNFRYELYVYRNYSNSVTRVLKFVTFAENEVVEIPHSYINEHGMPCI